MWYGRDALEPTATSSGCFSNWVAQGLRVTSFPSAALGGHRGDMPEKTVVPGNAAAAPARGASRAARVPGVAPPPVPPDPAHPPAAAQPGQAGGTVGCQVAAGKAAAGATRGSPGVPALPWPAARPLSPALPGDAGACPTCSAWSRAESGPERPDAGRGCRPRCSRAPSARRSGEASAGQALFGAGRGCGSTAAPRRPRPRSGASRERMKTTRGPALRGRAGSGSRGAGSPGGRQGSPETAARWSAPPRRPPPGARDAPAAVPPSPGGRSGRRPRHCPPRAGRALRKASPPRTTLY